jgi:hypothetical protein
MRGFCRYIPKGYFDFMISHFLPVTKENKAERSIQCAVDRRLPVDSGLSSACSLWFVDYHFAFTVLAPAASGRSRSC